MANPNGNPSSLKPMKPGETRNPGGMPSALHRMQRMSRRIVGLMLAPDGAVELDKLRVEGWGELITDLTNIRTKANAEDANPKAQDRWYNILLGSVTQNVNINDFKNMPIEMVEELYMRATGQASEAEEGE